MITCRGPEDEDGTKDCGEKMTRLPGKEGWGYAAANRIKRLEKRVKRREKVIKRREARIRLWKAACREYRARLMGLEERIGYRYMEAIENRRDRS